jgi:N-acetylneuraminate synthase
VLTKVIAELGINHNGDVETAKQMIDMAARCGCSAVKLQTRDVDCCYSPEKLASYLDSPHGNTYGDYARARELSTEALEVLIAYAHDSNLDIGTSFWDMVRPVDVLDLAWDFVKVPSAKIRHLALIAEVSSLYADVTLHISTGACTTAEIDAALKTIGESRAICLYHCTMAYPCADEDANLEMIGTLQGLYGFLPEVILGFSDHTNGIHVAQTAACLYPVDYIEKHVTLSRTMYGSDQALSLEESGLAKLVRNLNSIEASIGKGEGKDILPCEQNAYNRLVKNI